MQKAVPEQSRQLKTVSSKAKANSDLIGELEQYRRLLENIPAEIGVFDTEGRFLFNTPSGIPDATMRTWVVGKTHHDYSRKRGLPKSFAEKRHQIILQCVEEKSMVSFEEAIVDREGQQLYYLRTFSPVLDAAGEVTHVIGYGHEITELKVTEEKLRLALADVQQLTSRLHAENVYLQEEIKLQHNFGEIIGQSKALRQMLRKVERVAVTGTTVLILGESGTGKELIARAVHDLSERRERPLVKLNCAALPDKLIESELFGHEKGAFTGAHARRIGRFELADGSTIFLDEIGDLPLGLQVKLLRVLQEGEFERLGSSTTKKVDVRVIAATNRNLARAVADGDFREDLYYRLNVFPLTSPPLRERKEDIRVLVKHFVKKHSAKIGKRIERIPKPVMTKLMAYDWPGNVRELENVIERAMILSVGDRLELDDWPTGLPTAGASSLATLDKLEREHIVKVLELTGWRVSGDSGAARILDINPKTLQSRMKKLGIKRQL